MDAHGLLLELEYELKQLCDPNNTHIGIGFAFNKEQVRVVELVTQKTLNVNKMFESEDGGVEARGLIVDKSKVGLYAARVASLAKMNKDIKVVGPPNIQFNKNEGTFIVNIPGPIEDLFYSKGDPKVMQFYIRRTRVDAIEYGKPSDERIKVSDLELAYTLPLHHIPDPRTELEDAADMEREARDRALRKKKAEEEALVK